MVQRSLDDNVKRVLAQCAGERLVLLAPFMTAKPSVLRDELPRLRQRGFQRVRLNGTCAGCPATVMFLVRGMEEELRKRVPEVEYLEAVP